MKTQHKKVTWKVKADKADNRYASVYSGKLNKAGGVVDGGFIAHLIHVDNAHLIAAAPGLLQALLALRKWVDDSEPYGFDGLKRRDDCDDVVGLVNDAIAKARGEA